MPSNLALTGTSGKLGGSVHAALLKYQLTDPKSLVLSTSSSVDDPRWNVFKTQGTQVRSANFDVPESLQSAFADCEKAFIVSSSTLSLDFDNAAHGGREKHHIAAINAARKAGVKHIYYTSLGFGDPSKSAVMRAHLATEKFLRDHVHDVHWTILREGLYNESWPLYFGHWDVNNDNRAVVKVCGDGEISWTGIDDLGLATATILVQDSSKWSGKTVTLSSPDSCTLLDLAGLVSSAQGRAVSLEIVSKEEHEEYYVRDRGLNEGLVCWWSSSYDALQDGECLKADATLESILELYGRRPTPLKDTVASMIQRRQA